MMMMMMMMWMIVQGSTAVDIGIVDGSTTVGQVKFNNADNYAHQMVINVALPLNYWLK